MQRAKFHAFFGHNIRSRDNRIIEQDKVEVESKKALHGAFPVAFIEHSYG